MDNERAVLDYYKYNDSLESIDRNENPDLFLKYYFNQLELVKLLEDRQSLFLEYHFMKGSNFTHYGYYKQANWHLKIFLDKYDQLKTNFTKDIRYSYIERIANGYSLLAENFAKLKFLDSAKIYHKKNIEYNNSLDTLTIFKASALNNFGLFYFWRLDDADAALPFFKQSINFMEENFQNHLLLGSVEDNIADIELTNGQLESAKNRYYKNFEFYRTNKSFHTEIKIDIFRMVSAARQYTELAINLGELDRAKEVRDTLKYYFYTYPQYADEMLATKLDYLFTFKTLAEVENNKEEILKLTEAISDTRALIIERTEAKRQMSIVFNDANFKIAEDKFRQEKIDQENKIKNQKRFIWSLIIIGFLTILILVFLYDWRRKINIITENNLVIVEQEAELVAIKNLELQDELETKKKDLTDFALNLSHNQNWAKLLGKKLETINKTKGRQRAKLMEELSNEVFGKLSFDSENGEFYGRLDKLSSSFYNTLKESFPDLTKNEARLCSMIRLKVENRTIANLQNISLPSLHSSRYRLRKKLDLSEEQNLDKFIQNI